MKFSKIMILFSVFICILFINCSTTYIVHEIDPALDVFISKKRYGIILVLLAEDNRKNDMNIPNFDRTWGYLTDRGMYNNILTSKNNFNSVVADIIVNALSACGYDSEIMIENNNNENDNVTIIKPIINEFWVEGRSKGLAYVTISTVIDVKLVTLKGESDQRPFDISVKIEDEQRKGCFSMSQAVDATIDVCSENIEKFKSLLVNKISEAK